MDRTFRWIDRGRQYPTHRLVTLTLAILLGGAAASAQLVTNLQAIPRTGKPPVVFVNGYQNTCDGATFKSTFGIEDELLQKDNRVSIFFNTCIASDHPPIEDLGNKLKDVLQSLKYDNGEPVPQVDIVTHSMGGLVVRSYLSGKQVQEGAFTPPADTKVRKIVFLGTPHFGTPATSLLAGLGQKGDRQTDELELGSTFIFDLATWNQGGDDLRGADAIAVLGDVASGFLLMNSRFGDGVTTLTSGSLGFVSTERTRIIPYCHTSSARIFCHPTDTKGTLADIDSADHPSARTILSFLNNTTEWRSIGQAAEQNTFLSKQGGLFVRYRDINDRPQTLTSVKAGTDSLTVNKQNSQIAYIDQIPSEQPAQLTLTTPGESASASVPLSTGTTRAVTVKSGPSISGIFPSFAAVFPRSVAPGSLISIYGVGLTIANGGSSEVTVAGQHPPISYAGPNQINTLVPANASGLVRVQVKNVGGEHTVNLLVEPIVPAVFAGALNAVTNVLITPQTPLHPGDYVALFVTGLGATTLRNGLSWANVQPEVTVGGQPCAVTFAGRAPGYEGLDQINCQLSAATPASDTAEVAVRSGSRASNVMTLPVR